MLLERRKRTSSFFECAVEPGPQFSKTLHFLAAEVLEGPQPRALSSMGGRGQVSSGAGERVAVVASRGPEPDSKRD